MPLERQILQAIKPGLIAILSCHFSRTNFRFFLNFSSFFYGEQQNKKKTRETYPQSLPARPKFFVRPVRAALGRQIQTLEFFAREILYGKSKFF